MQWLSENRIQVDPPKKPLKITGTRFAAIMGMNKWSSPFKVWCEITRTYKEPFEDTIYTIAGKVIEPKQAQYMIDSYGMLNLQTPEQAFGKNHFKTMHGDFFHEHPILGGMWDYRLMNGSTPTAVLEMKTSKRSEDWSEDIPEYYALQAALYAHLMGVEDCLMVATFLSDSDYEHPEEFVPSAKNTIIVPFRLHERYPNFDEYVQFALNWWDVHVNTGISPAYDEKVDADILKELRTNHPKDDDDISAVIAEAEALSAELALIASNTDAKQKRLKELTEAIKAYATAHFRDGDTKVVLSGQKLDFTIAKTTRTAINKAALEADGLLAKYTTQEESYKITSKERK